jgi:hypothetical protein
MVIRSFRRLLLALFNKELFLVVMSPGNSLKISFKEICDISLCSDWLDLLFVNIRFYKSVINYYFREIKQNFICSG